MCKGPLPDQAERRPRMDRPCKRFAIKGEGCSLSMFAIEQPDDNSEKCRDDWHADLLFGTVLCPTNDYMVY